MTMFQKCQSVLAISLSRVRTHLRWRGKFYYKHMQRGGYSRLNRYFVRL